MGFDKCTGWCSYHSCIKRNIDRFAALKIPLCFVCLAREEPEGRVSGVQVVQSAERPPPDSQQREGSTGVAQHPPEREEPGRRTALPSRWDVDQGHCTQPSLSPAKTLRLGGASQGLPEGLKQKSACLQAFEFIYKITRLLTYAGDNGVMLQDNGGMFLQDHYFVVKSKMLYNYLFQQISW